MADGGQQCLAAIGEFLRVGEQTDLQIHRVCCGRQVSAASVPHELPHKGCHPHRDQPVRPVRARDRQHPQCPREPGQHGQPDVPAVGKDRHPRTDDDEHQIGGLPLLTGQPQVQAWIRDHYEESQRQNRTAVTHAGAAIGPRQPEQAHSTDAGYG